MLTKRCAPPRLQRWGSELAEFLPHLKISYRKGADNGLADLLSRFSAFAKYTTIRRDIVELPDDLFDRIGDAPLYSRRPRDGKEYLEHATYQLYDPKQPKTVSGTLWTSAAAPEIPGRGSIDRWKPEFASDPLVRELVGGAKYESKLEAMVAHMTDGMHEPQLPPSYARIFLATYNRQPRVLVSAGKDDKEALRCELSLRGMEITDDPANEPDIAVTVLPEGDANVGWGRACHTLTLHDCGWRHRSDATLRGRPLVTSLVVGHWWTSLWYG